MDETLPEGVIRINGHLTRVAWEQRKQKLLAGKARRMDVLLNYNGTNAPGSPGHEQWCDENGAAILDKDIYRARR